MKKIYSIQWQHITGITGALQTYQIFEFYERFSELLEDKHVSNGSIVFHSEEVPLEGLKEGIVYPMSNEEYLREWEYRKFKGGKK